MTHELIVAMATLFGLLPDAWSITLLGGELILNGDGSYITGEQLGRMIY